MNLFCIILEIFGNAKYLAFKLLTLVIILVWGHFYFTISSVNSRRKNVKPLVWILLNTILKNVKILSHLSKLLPRKSIAGHQGRGYGLHSLLPFSTNLDETFGMCSVNVIFLQLLLYKVDENSNRNSSRSQIFHFMRYSF